MIRFSLFAAAGLLVAASASAQVKEMPPGLWEIKHKMDMTMNSARGSMKMQTEGKRIADTCEEK